MIKKNLLDEKIKFFGFLFFGLFFGLSGVVSAYSGGGGICSCGDGTTAFGGSATDACDDCEAALNDNADCADRVNYAGIVPITDYSETCIDNPANFNNKVFDCQGHTIDGDKIWSDVGDSGIYLDGKSGNIIKNCIVIDFQYGIRLYGSSNNTIISNSVNSNDYSIELESSSNNKIISNTANSMYYGITLRGSSNNNITNNLGHFC